MKDKRKNARQKELEKNWEKAAALFEEEKAGIEIMEGSKALSTGETRELLGRGGKNKLISIRLPEEELAAVKKIAETHGRKYQQLIGEALSQFLNRYFQLQLKKNKSP